MRIVRTTRAWILAGLVGSARDPTSPLQPLEPVAVLQVEPESVRMAVGDTVELTASARTAGGTDLPGLVEWESSAPTAVSVSSTGRAIALEPGDSPVRLIARVRHGGAELADTVSVTLFERRLRIIGTRRVLVGRTHPLSLWDTPIGGEMEFDLPGAWLSSDTTITTIGASGELRGVRPGEATITARVGGSRDTARIRVEASGYSVKVLGNLVGTRSGREG